MNPFECLRPASVAEATALMQGDASATASAGRAWLAGGQSLLAAMKLGMATPALLVDLQDLPGLREIRLETGAQGEPALWIGAMATHASVAASEIVRRIAPGLADLAGGIADAQVRSMGTIGGSLAHNDPAACWPAGVLAAGATVVTSQREIAADEYFQDLYTTALGEGELILGVRFAHPGEFRYLKFEQPASRFATVGVAIARAGGPGARVRVAVTGLGLGVTRWPGAEQALSQRFAPQALDPLTDANDLKALGDLHACADYRCHLALVLARRCMAQITGIAPPAPAPLTRAAPRAANAAPREAAPDGFGGEQVLAATPEQVWQAILDPRHLQTCIPGCEALQQLGALAYEATVKVGLGPLSVRFKSEVSLSDPRPPETLTLGFAGQAGALGSGRGTARIRLEPVAGGGTRLHWWVQVQLAGRLAQFGTRLVEATARKLSEEFFKRLERVLQGDAASRPVAASWLQRLLERIERFFSFLGK